MLGYAALKGNKEFVELLLSHGADPFVADETGLTALKEAQFRRRHEIAELIESYMNKKENKNAEQNAQPDSR